MSAKLKFLGVYTMALLWLSCDTFFPPAPSDASVLDGPIESLTKAERLQFALGDEAFSAVFDASKGLGPIFVSNQCASCHPGDGKGSAFVEFFRFGQSDTFGNTFLHLGGPQLQHKALPGYTPEKLPNNASKTKLIAPAVTGLGFLDAVSDQFLLSIADPFDADGDGISGRPHFNKIPPYVILRPNAVERDGKYISRFGKKAGAYDLLHQTAGAYNQDMGIVSNFEPHDPATGQRQDPEITDKEVQLVVFYLKTLKAPIQRDADNPEVLAGQRIFSTIGCARCHLPTMTTSSSPIEALNFKTFHPYTDLLLHDMGAELNDGYTEGYALTSEWRTPALWGLGLSKDAQGGNYLLMHDGRATTINDAIRMHGGEGKASVNGYMALSSTERNQLILFLESL